MSTPKKIVDAKKDTDGNISAVLIEGNTTFTPAKTALRMAEQKKIDAVAVHPKKGKAYIRTRPDSESENNLNAMADDD